MERAKLLLQEVLTPLERRLSPSGFQLLKLGLLFSTLATINGWINANHQEIFIESGNDIGELRTYVWFFLVLLSLAGVFNLVGYAVIANPKFFTTLKLPVILFLTVLTAGASTGPVLDGRIVYYLHEGRIIYLLYPIVVSVAVVLLRYFLLRRKGQLGVAEK